MVCDQYDDWEFSRLYPTSHGFDSTSKLSASDVAPESTTISQVIQERSDSVYVGRKTVMSLLLDYLHKSVSVKAEAKEETGSSTVQHLTASEIGTTSPSWSTSPVVLSVSPSSTSSSLSQSSPSSSQSSSSYDLSSTTGLHQMPNNNHVDKFNTKWRQEIHRKGEFACGWGAAFINICVTFPINKAIFRQQLHNISGLRAARQLHKDGIQFLYRGLLPPLLQKTTSLSIMFGAYYRCQDYIHEVAPQLSIIANHTTSALVAGTMEAMLAPFERVQTLMQTREFHQKFSHTMDAFNGLRSYGIREYYRGFSLILLRNGPSNVCFFLGREYLQTCGPQELSKGKRVIKDFICGACLGALISTFFFPLNVVKTHMQCKLGGPFEGVWSTFRLVLSERKGKLWYLFRGVHLNYTRSFISWGIINASYEILMKNFFQQEMISDRYR